MNNDVTAFSAGMRQMGKAFGQLADTAEAVNHSLRQFGNVLDQWRRDFESRLTFSEMKRYLRLQDAHPEWGFCDVAVVIERERVSARSW